jgi:hypothetical protein
MPDKKVIEAWNRLFKVTDELHHICNSAVFQMEKRLEAEESGKTLTLEIFESFKSFVHDTMIGTSDEQCGYIIWLKNRSKDGSLLSELKPRPLFYDEILKLDRNIYSSIKAYDQDENEEDSKITSKNEKMNFTTSKANDSDDDEEKTEPTLKGIPAKFNKIMKNAKDMARTCR